MLRGAKAADGALRTWHFVTDEHGKINGQNPTFADGFTNDALYKDKDGKVCYPLGTYLIQEVKAPEGYLVNDEILEVTITEDGTDNLHVKTYNEKIKGDDTIIRGGVKLAKIDNDLDEAYAQGDATLKGAEFTIYNQSAETVMVKGKEISKGDAALVITTNADGIATSGDHDLPYGSYLVKETKPSKGYLLNTEWSRSFRIREDGVIIDLTEDKVREAVIRGGVQIIKRDKELVKSEALGGAHLDGIVMTIKNVSGRDVVVRKDLDNKTDLVDWKKLESKKDLFESEAIKRIPTGKDVGKITVHWNEEKKAYTAETLPDDLPYGTYTIRESKTNESYQRTDKSEHMFTIREDGVMVSFDDNQNEMALTFDDYVYRSDVQGTKIADSTSERFSYVPFKIISVTNGETHVVVTDANGFFSTKDRRSTGDIDEDEEADTARKQNPFDDLLEAKEIKTADLKKRSGDILHGVWFGTGEFGDNRTKYYSDKRGIIYTEIMLPVNAPPEYADRNTLWNAVEAVENNWNSQLARRFEIALPKELPMEQRVELIREHCFEQFVSKGMIADIAIHDPDPPEHNPHAHVMLTMRPMDEHGRWMEKAHREYILDENGERIRDAKGKWKFRKVPTVDWNEHSNAEIWRHAWEVTQNKYLAAAGRSEKVSMKSYARQGIDRIPTVHMGPAVTAMERRGIMTNIGNLNRDIKAANKLMDVLKRTIVRLIGWLEEIRQAIAEIDMKPKEVPLVDLLVMSFEESITDRRGRKFTTQSEAEKFNSVVSYMRERDVLTVEDLDKRLTELNAESLPIRDQIKHLSSRIKTIEKLIEHGDRRASLDAVHDEYLSIHWKGKKEKFAKDHKDELEAWKQSDRYMRKNLPDQKYNGEALRAELSSLTSELDSLTGKIRPHQEEAEMLKEVRSYVEKLLPELMPDGEALTPERRQEKITAVQERLAKAKAEAEKRAADYEKSRQTADRNDRGR